MESSVNIALITECYSPANLGDYELVASSISVVGSARPDCDVEIVALEKERFSEIFPNLKVHGRLFNREAFAAGSSLTRPRLVLSWAVYVTVLSVLALLLPKSSRRSISIGAIRYLPDERIRTVATRYATASGVYPVGGGYLADRYLRESVLTLWSWWWVGRLGTKVATMPISVEAARKPMRAALRLLGTSVSWTLRDHTSVDVLRSCGLSGCFSPDLAFRNVVKQPICAEQQGRPRILVVPIGGDYYDDEVWRNVMKETADAINALRMGSQTSILTMHAPVCGGYAGKDHHAATYLASLLPGSNIVERGDVADYQALCRMIQDTACTVVTSRMHAAIASICADRPPIVMGYEVKHQALMERFNLSGLYIDFPRTTAQWLENRLKELWSWNNYDYESFHFLAVSEYEMVERFSRCVS